MVNRSGFTAIELLVTLFVAALALATGYQLYAAVINQDSKTRLEAEAGLIAHSEIKKYNSSATAPCAPQTITSDSTVTISETSAGSVTGKLTVLLDCPNTTLPNLSRITVTITYGSPMQTVRHASYITPGTI